MKTVILLDWDGVLCNSLDLYYDFYQRACARHQIAFPMTSLENFRDWYNARWEENFYEMGFSEPQFQDVLQFWQDTLHYDQAALFPQVGECLRLWSAEFPLGIVSTTPSQTIRARLRADDLEKYFVHFTGGEDGSTEKRDKVGETLRSMGADRGVMVGDTPLDIDAGQFNGLKTVGVTYGWVSPQRVREAGPDRVVDDPSLLGDTVLQLAREVATAS